MNILKRIFVGLIAIFLAFPLLAQTYTLVNINWSKKGVAEYIQNRKGEFIYEKTSAGVLHFSENLKRYPKFLEFLEKEITYENISKIHKQFEQNKLTNETCKECIGFYFFAKEKGKNVSFVIDAANIKAKSDLIRKISDFLRNFGEEHGCPKTYEIYQLKKGETLETIAKKLNMDYESLSYYNYENKIGFCTVNTFSEKEDCNTIEPKAGHYILIPCIPKKQANN